MSKCRRCLADIVWLKTLNNKNMPVNADSYHGEKEYDRTIHVPHWNTCPYAEDFRKGKPNA